MRPLPLDFSFMDLDSEIVCRFPNSFLGAHLTTIIECNPLAENTLLLNQRNSPYL